MALTAGQLQQKLVEIDALRNEIQGALAGLTSQQRIKALEDAQPHIKTGTKEHEVLLATGYGMTIAEANSIIKERDADPTRWPLEEYRKAKAMIAAYKAKPVVSSSRKGWKRG